MLAVATITFAVNEHMLREHEKAQYWDYICGQEKALIEHGYTWAAAEELKEKCYAIWKVKGWPNQ